MAEVSADPGWSAAAGSSFALLPDAMAALAPGLDARTRRARLALVWAGAHGLCTLRAEGSGGDLWTAEVAEDLVALIVAACAAPVGTPGGSGAAVPG